ncbi:MAG: phosphomannomutase [Xanthomonadaceae bacterium]|nr:phosphomannomutase [Xanthomonadaceae bacterium]
MITTAAPPTVDIAAVYQCFKAYDVRGRVPEQLNEGVAWRIGRAYAELFGARKVAIGRDVRVTSVPLANALSEGLRSAGTTVCDIGLCGTEEIYFATTHMGLDGGIMVTASHNPPEYNGMKFVREDAQPVGLASGLREIAARAAGDQGRGAVVRGQYERMNVRAAYVRHILSFVDLPTLKPFKVVVNAGNGCAGPVIDALAKSLPVELVKLNHEPDGSFPNGVPNPLLPEMRAETANAVVQAGADLGVAWDGDFDRCFLFDERGRFIDGYYIVGLLAKTFLAKWPGAKIVHDPRLVWSTVDLVTRGGGVPVMSRCGHTNLKDAMRSANAVYGGEMSGHHYFRDFAYCDSGMIPWLIVLELLSRSGARLSELVAERMRRFPSSGEINREVSDIPAVTQRVIEHYRDDALDTSYLDGVSMEFPEWRFNLRPSNTEPLLRLNIETRGDELMLRRRTQELMELLG